MASPLLPRSGRTVPDYQVIDTDQAIEELEGCSIADLFVQKGAIFGTAKQLLKSIEPTARQIISCGGGMILRAENRRIMGELGPVICLRQRQRPSLTVLKKITNVRCAGQAKC